MKYAKFGAVVALLIGSIGFGSAVTQGSSSPATTSPATAGERDVTDQKSPGGAAPDGQVTSSNFIDGGYVFVPITGYRTYDSRLNFPGRILDGEEQIFTVITDEFDVPQIPSDAVAVTYNITVTGTLGGPGYLAVYPADTFWPGNASVNWTADGTTVGNGGTAAIGFWTEDGQIAVTMGSLPGASTDYILDITGYYKA